MVTANSNQATLDIVYDGPALSDGSMEVRDLAHAMLGVGELFEAANQVLNYNDTSIQVNVRATSAGSFEIGFTVIQNIEATNMMASSFGDLISPAADMITLVLGASGLFGLIKWLKGRIPQFTPTDSNEFDVTVGNETRRVSFAIRDLYNNPNISVKAETVIRPLKTNGITDVSFRDERGQTIQQVNEDDADSFNAISLQEPIQDNIREMTFSIVALSFKVNNIWRLSDGQNTYSARIRDPNFWGMVENSQASFRNGDLLRCNFRTRQYKNNEGIKTEYEVLEVLRHEPNRQQQLNAIFDDNVSSDIE
ncbi:MAG: hypothetical protein OXC95_00330 [Dehalococcoidia bacterium]|nr:hypothetical protein [Dehalococcoidia bacterium]